MFFLHILILYHLLEEVIFTLYYLYTTTTLRAEQSQARPMVTTWAQIEEVLIGVVEASLGGADVNETLESAKAEIEAIAR